MSAMLHHEYRRSYADIAQSVPGLSNDISIAEPYE